MEQWGGRNPCDETPTVTRLSASATRSVTITGINQTGAKAVAVGATAATSVERDGGGGRHRNGEVAGDDTWRRAL
jgi:hypothetical protein